MSDGRRDFMGHSPDWVAPIVSDGAGNPVDSGESGWLRAEVERLRAVEAERDAYLTYAAFVVRSQYSDWLPERAVEHVLRMSRDPGFAPYSLLAECRAAVKAMREQQQEAPQ